MGTRREGTIRVGAWVGATLAALVLAAASASAQDTVRVAVEVEGLEGDLEANALAVMALARQEDEPLAVDRARALFERAPEEVLTALEPFGRYGSRWIPAPSRGSSGSTSPSRARGPRTRASSPWPTASRSSRATP
ncbi:MAG: POTRA domain-containing protein [Gemmatimonadota bacterium]